MSFAKMVSIRNRLLLLFVAALTYVWVCILGVAQPANAASFCDPACLLMQAQVLRQKAGRQVAEFPETVQAHATSLAALGRFNDAIVLAESIKPLEWRASALSRIALAQSLSGDHDGAAALFAEAVDDLEAIKVDTFGARRLFALVADMARSGDLPAARAAAIRLTQGRLPWMYPAALATIAFSAEQAGLSASALWEAACSSTRLSTNPDWHREPDWDLLAMEMVGRRAAAAGHPDVALALADAADKLIADLPPRLAVIDPVPRRETAPGELRVAAIAAMSRQGDYEAALRELDRYGPGGFSELGATFGMALATVARRIEVISSARDSIVLADAVRRATESVTGKPEHQISWLADIAPAFGRLGDKANQTTVFDRIERLVPTIISDKTISAFRLKVSALVSLAVARHRAGQTSEVDATFNEAEAKLGEIATRNELDAARWVLVTGLAATGRGATAWALIGRFQAALPSERLLRYSAFNIALHGGYEDQALWMIDQSTLEDEKEGFLAQYSGMLAEKGLFEKAQALANAVKDPRSKAGALTELAQAMISARGGQLHPSWVQWPDPEKPYAGHLSIESYWPLYRDLPFDPTLDF